MRTEEATVNFINLSLLAGCASGLVAAPGNALMTKSRQAGFYLSPMVDSGEEDCTYGRLEVDADSAGAKLEVIVAATNSRTAVINGEETDLDAWLQNPRTDPLEKARALMELEYVRAANTSDILLRPAHMAGNGTPLPRPIRGRYAWVWVALYPLENSTPCLRSMRLGLPWRSFTEYLPEIYQGDDFTERFVSVFQSLFLDVERKVDTLPTLLDYQRTPDENVELLAGWLGIDNSRGLFSPAQLRHLIANIELFQGKKGTRLALEELVLLVSGIRPHIVEYFQWMRPELSARQKEAAQLLYGDGPDDFCMILDMTRTDTLPVAEADLEWLVQANSPFGSRCRLVYLRNTSHTDTHCYLGVNSVLSVPQVAAVDGGTLGGHITVG